MWKEFIGASCLVIGFFALHDKFNNTVATKESQGLVPFFMGILLTGLHLTTCLVSCTEFNPAVDIAGRIFYLLSGHGTDVVTNTSSYFWIPIMIPYLGALWGSLIYKSTISWHWPELKTKEISQQPPRLIKEEKVVDVKGKNNPTRCNFLYIG